MNTIARIWNGDMEPMKGWGKNDPQIAELIELIERNEENLTGTLCEKQKLIFEKYNSCLDEYWDLMAEQDFCEGFRLGTRLLAEAFTANK